MRSIECNDLNKEYKSLPLLLYSLKLSLQTEFESFIQYVWQYVHILPLEPVPDQCVWVSLFNTSTSLFHCNKQYSSSVTLFKLILGFARSEVLRRDYEDCCLLGCDIVSSCLSIPLSRKCFMSFCLHCHISDG